MPCRWEYHTTPSFDRRFHSISWAEHQCTGITGGITATTQLLSSLGAEVIVTARSHEKLEQSLADLSDKVSGGVLDLTDEESIKAFFEKTGNFDHLVTTAASSMLATLKEMNFKAAKELIASLI